jgi:hypothetical protein
VDKGGCKRESPLHVGQSGDPSGGLRAVLPGLFSGLVPKRARNLRESTGTKEMRRIREQLAVQKEKSIVEKVNPSENGS